MWTSQSSCNSPVKWDTTTSATSTSSTVSTSFTCLLMFVVFFVILLGVVGVLVVIVVVIVVVVGVLVLVHDVVVVDIIYMYILYIYYIYICVCMYEHFQKHEHKTSHWHDTHIQGISNLHDPYYIFFLKLSSDFAYFAGRSGLERKGPSFRCGRCRSLGALTARRLEVKDPRQSKRRRWFWCKRWNMGKDGETLNRKIS